MDDFIFGDLYEDDYVECSKCGSKDGYYESCPYAMDIHGTDEECDCCTDCRNDCAADI